MNKFTVPILFTLTKLLSLLNFQEQKEPRRVYPNAKDIDTRLSRTIYTKRAFTDTVFQKDKDEFTFYGPLAIGLFACETLLLPNVNLRLKLIRSSPAFYMIDTGGLNSEALILEACLFTRQVAISDNWMRSFKSRLLREPAIFYYNEELPKTFIIPAGQNQFIQEKYFQTNQFE